MERDDLKIILNILYEMEGLVDMAIRREDETPAGVMCLIKEKSEMLHKYTSAWNIENDIEININEDYSIDEESELEVNDNPESQLDDRNVGLNYQEPDEDIEVEFVYDDLIGAHSCNIVVLNDNIIWRFQKNVTKFVAQ